MFLLKALAFALAGLVSLAIVGVFFIRLQPRLSSWYYKRNEPKPEVVPTQFDQSVTDQLDTHLANGDFGRVKTFIVSQSGEKLYEFNQPGVSSDELFRVWSVSKSVVSAAYGAGIEQGLIDGVDVPISQAFPEFSDSYAADPLRNSVTAADLLTMRSGFKWDESGYPSDYHLFARSSDWMAYMAAREMARPGGEQFVYNTANTIVLAEFIGRQTGQPFEQFVTESLFDKMGITNWRWEYGPNGVVQAGGGLNLSPNDMLKIGQLYLNQGEWEGEQLVNREWIEESLAVQASIPNYLDYGYHWWLVPNNSPLARPLAVNDAYFASGLGGNYIWIVPHLDLVIVITAQDGSGQMELAWPALKHFIFPALAEK
ncbi:MAG: serine hydrolase domain-containing protein [Anaerolineae bacterium]